MQDILVVVDVGAAGGLGSQWQPYLDKVHPVLIEPNPHEAARLQSTQAGQVLTAALAGATGPRTLYVTRCPLCSSLLEPDMEVLNRYTVSSCFDVVRTDTVNCFRYDEIPNAPAPGVIKIDVQDAEYEALLGFGRYLNTVMAIELESHLYPIYKGQRLLGDLVAFLASYGLRLALLLPQMNFDEEYTGVNAWFCGSGLFRPTLSGNGSFA
jgi:FkbM family methyltransferase